MRTKQEIIHDIEEGIKNGVITEQDLAPFLMRQPAPAAAVSAPSPAAEAEKKSERLSAVDVMFYIAGIVLFSAIMSIIVQTWNDGSVIGHIVLSAGVGAGLWSVAYYLIRSSIQSDVRRGLINSLLLTGSLSVIAGGYIIMNTIIGGFDDVNFIPAAFALALLGALHIGFDRLIKKDLILLMGVLLAVATLPSFLFGVVQNADAGVDVWSSIVLVSAGLLAYATRVTAKFNPDRPKLHNTFDGLAAFLGLGSIYVASYGDYGAFWLVVLIAAVFGIFYLSIISQNKDLLGNGSFFLVVTIITISFKYFSGYGATVSLVLSTIGLLGSAAIAAGINKKYFKRGTIEPIKSAAPPPPPSEPV